MGRRKGGLDFTRDYHHRRKIKGREIVLMLFIFLAALAVGTFVFFTLKKHLNQPEAEEGTPTPAPTPTQAEEMEKDGDDSENSGDGEEPQEAGPYGMWVVPKEEERSQRRNSGWKILSIPENGRAARGFI